MKSQSIKTRNLPVMETQPYIVHVKPIAALAVIGLAGVGLLFTRSVWGGAGVVMILVSVFSLLMLPDRYLIQFTPDYMVLYNHRSMEECTIVYWDDIVNWQYEYHKGFDVLVLSLTDGSTQTIELYSKRSIERFMNQYAPGKELKSARRKD